MEQRVIFDSNIWISFAIGKRLDELKATLTHPKVSVFICQKLLWEVRETIQKPKFTKYVSPHRKQLLIELMESCHFVDIEEQIFISRDPNDNFLLDLAATIHANYLITDDNDLLILNNFQRTAIVSFRSFMAILDNF